MKISIIGTRGIPPRYGGFETFAYEISGILVNNGFTVAVQCDSGSFDLPVYNGVDLFFSPVKKTGNQFRYYYEGIKWGLKNSDLLIIAGTGGSVFYLLNLFFRKKIITNPDGLEYKRNKWPWYVKMALILIEALAYYFSDYIVADSKAIRDSLIRKYKLSPGKIKVIEYGATINDTFNEQVLKKYSLKHKNYYLAVCRLEPENNLHIILEAYTKSNANPPLIIVGNKSGSDYALRIIKEYKSDKILFLGGIYDKEELKALRYSCRAYFHGHSVGGTNPSLLEAMAAGNTVLCHDNVFNREVTDNSQIYFKSVNDCTEKIKLIENMSENELEKFGNLSRSRIKTYYNWHNIGNKYIEFLRQINV